MFLGIARCLRWDASKCVPFSFQAPEFPQRQSANRADSHASEYGFVCMAKIEDLIAQIPDERLRKRIAAEVKALKKTKKFGLVFEEHLPETVRLPRLPVNRANWWRLRMKMSYIISVHQRFTSSGLRPPSPHPMRRRNFAALCVEGVEGVSFRRTNPVTARSRWKWPACIAHARRRWAPGNSSGSGCP